MVSHNIPSYQQVVRWQGCTRSRSKDNRQSCRGLNPFLYNNRSQSTNLTMQQSFTNHIYKNNIDREILEDTLLSVCQDNEGILDMCINYLVSTLSDNEVEKWEELMTSNFPKKYDQSLLKQISKQTKVSTIIGTMPDTSINNQEVISSCN